MLVIRLRRTGKINQAMYSVVVAEKTSAVKGKFLETVGSYDTAVKPKKFTFNKEKIASYISHGAVPSDTVAALLKANGVAGMEKFIKTRTKKRAKKGEAASA